MYMSGSECCSVMDLDLTLAVTTVPVRRDPNKIRKLCVCGGGGGGVRKLCVWGGGMFFEAVATATAHWREDCAASSGK